MPNWKKIITSGSDAALNSLVVTNGITGSLFGTSSFAISSSRAISSSFASTASFINTLNQNVLITGSLTVGATTIGASENTLTLGPKDNGSEGGQLMLQAPGGTNTSASMLDNYQNSTRLLRGTNAGSDAVVAQWNMHSRQMQLPAYTSTGAFPGSAAAFLAVDSSGNLITTSSAGGGGGGVTINNNVDNYIITATGTVNTLNGESNLQFNGSSLTVTGEITSSGAIRSLANNSMYFRGGDDAEFWDINLSNHVGIYGQQDQGVASIKLGSGGGTVSGRSGSIGINTTTPTSASLTVNGNVWATSFTGSLLGTSSYALQALSSSFALTAYVNLQDVTTIGNQTSQSINISSSLTNGFDVIAPGIFSHAEGIQTISTGSFSHAEGIQTNSSGSYSHAEGAQTLAVGSYSHAEGYLTNALADGSHAEGEQTFARQIASHAEGAITQANGYASHTEGYLTVTDNSYQHAEGIGTVATTQLGQHVEGTYNISDPNAIWIVGDGTDALNRSNLIAAYTDILTVTGSLRVQGPIIASSYTGSFTGSLLGTSSFSTSASFSSTASFVLNAISSSFASTASFVNPLRQNVLITGSLLQSGSIVVTGSISSPSITGSLFGTASLSTSASFASTASFVLNAVSASFASTASFVLNAISASFASTASSVNPLNQNVVITGSLTVITGSAIELQVLNTGVRLGNLSTDTHTVTGSLQIAGQTRISGSFNTAVSGTILTVLGSGSTQPIFTIQGSQGELFSVTDSLTGSLFSVNDISGLPILEVFSDNTTTIGSYIAPALYTTNRITQTNSGSFVVYSLPTASYDGAFYDYTVRSGSNARAGQIMAIWSGSSVNFTESRTTSFGNTAGINFTVIVSGSNMVLTGSSATGSWTIKTIIRSI